MTDSLKDALTRAGAAPTKPEGKPQQRSPHRIYGRLGLSRAGPTEAATETPPRN